MDFLITVGQASGGSGGIGSFLLQFAPIILIFLVFWFLVFRPQSKRRQKHQEFLESLKAGDEIWTEGGILGEVVEVDDEIVTIRVRGGDKLDVYRQKIAGSQSNLGDSEEDDSE
jgi:preprotein translocase subunit YajC